MKAFASLVAVFGVVALLMPGLDAQDAKDVPKTEDKDEKKVEAKKKPIVKADEATVVSAPKILAKIKDIKSDDAIKEVIVTTVDNQKLVEFTQWDNKAKNDIRVGKGDPRPRIEKYQKDLLSKFDDIFVGEMKTVHVSDAMRVRTKNPPPVYDAAGNLKKHTAADLTKFKGGALRLPGYVADFSALKVNQVVEISLLKSATPVAKKAPPPLAKKGFIGDDPTLNVGTGAAGKIEAYMILVVQD